MQPISFYCKAGGKCSARHELRVEENAAQSGTLRLTVVDKHNNTAPIVLNPVQVDKLRQVFHGWLHEQALGEDGVNWVEEAPATAVVPTRGL